MSIKLQLSSLFQLASADGYCSPEEKMYILTIGKANGLHEKEIMDLVDRPSETPVSPETMDEEEKFEFLFHIVQLMKLDSMVYTSEVRFCETIAEKLGYDKRVISRIASRMHADPTITINKEALKKEVQRYK